MNINKAGIPFGMVAFTTNKAVSNAEITVTALAESSQVSFQVYTKLFKYLKLDTKNLADSAIGNAEIEFFVSNAWMKENIVAEADISLFRYTDNQWHELPTVQIGSDATNAYYRASTPGFSYFAIASKVLPLVGVPDTVQPYEPAPAVQGMAVAEPVTAAQVEKKSNRAMFFASALVLMIIAFTFIIFKSRKMRNERNIRQMEEHLKEHSKHSESWKKK